MNADFDVDLTGTRVSHYAIVAPIAAGGMGRVYLGRDERLRRHVAVKVLRSPDSSVWRSERLLTEARFHAQFAHPSVASVYDFVEQDGREFLIMEFVAGVTLSEILAGGPLPYEEVMRLGRQLAHGLAAAHAAGVVHRDVKPQNLKLTSAGRLKIVDFGIAVAGPAAGLPQDSIETQSAAHNAGTVPYMSPEQLRGGAVDHRSDIFSAGAVLYEMATGRSAFPQRSLAELVNAVLYEQPPAVTSLNPLVPASFDRVVFKALAKEPERRFPSASALAHALRLVQGGSVAGLNVTSATMAGVTAGAR
jgi:eukaryotic-like serine/threonine-protein kinase